VAYDADQEMAAVGEMGEVASAPLALDADASTVGAESLVEGVEVVASVGMVDSLEV